MMAFPSTFPDCSISRDIFKEPFPGFGERISLACVTGDENWKESVFLDYEHLVCLLGDDWVIIKPNTDLEILR